jgi:hypothetical protein
MAKTCPDQHRLQFSRHVQVHIYEVVYSAVKSSDFVTLLNEYIFSPNFLKITLGDCHLEDEQLDELEQYNVSSGIKGKSAT